MIKENQWYVIPDNYTAEFLDEVFDIANHKAKEVDCIAFADIREMVLRNGYKLQDLEKFYKADCLCFNIKDKPLFEVNIKYRTTFDHRYCMNYETYIPNSRIMKETYKAVPITELYTTDIIATDYISKSIKEGNNMKEYEYTRIINNWRDTNVRNIEIAKNNAIRIAKKESKIGKIALAYIEEANLNRSDRRILGAVDDIAFDNLVRSDYLSNDEYKAINNLVNIYDKQMEEIEKTANQAQMMVAVAETFDQAMTILQKYKIIDKDYQIITKTIKVK